MAALAEGRPAIEVLEEGLIAGMRVVGEDFKHNRRTSVIVEFGCAQVVVI